MSRRADGVHDRHMHARVLYNFGMLKFRTMDQQLPQNTNYESSKNDMSISLTCDIENILFICNR